MSRTALRPLRAAPCETDPPWSEEVSRFASEGFAQGSEGSQGNVLTSTLKPGESGAADTEPTRQFGLSPPSIPPETSQRLSQ